MKTILVLHLFDQNGALQSWTYEWRGILRDSMRMVFLEDESCAFPLLIERNEDDTIRCVGMLGNGSLKRETEYIRVTPFMLDPKDHKGLMEAAKKNGWTKNIVPPQALPGSEEYVRANPKTAHLMPNQAAE